MKDWSSEERLWARVAIGVSIVSAVWTFFLATQANVIWEEAHFLMAGRNPDWGYPDTPAGSPLFVAFSEAIFGDSRIGIRSLTWAVSCLLPLAVYWLATPMVSRTQALMAAAFSAVLPPCLTSNIFAYPEGPLQVVTALFFGAFVRAVFENKRLWWVLAGLICAIGMAYYYRFWIVPIAVLVFLLVSGKGRAQWLNSNAWMAGIIAALGLLPSLIDNLTKNWDPLLYHLGRRQDWQFFPDAANYPLQQAGLVTPVVFGFLIAAGIYVFREWLGKSDAKKGLFAISASVLFFPFFVLAFFDTNYLPHWPFFAYIVLLPFLPGRMVGFVECVSAARQRIAALSLIGLGLLLILVTDVAFGLNLLAWRHADTVLSEDQRGWLRGGDLEDYSKLEAPLADAFAEAGEDAILVGGDHITTLRASMLGKVSGRAFVLDHPKDLPRRYQDYRGRLGQGEAALFEEQADKPAIILLADPSYLYREAELVDFRAKLCANFANVRHMWTKSLAPGEVQLSAYSGQVLPEPKAADAAACDALPNAWLEQPRAGKIVTGVTPVYGVAADPAGIKFVHLLIDGERVQKRANLADLPGYRFPELLSFSPDYPNVYWDFSVDFSNYASGRHSLSIEVEAKDGSVSTFGKRDIYVR